MTGKKRRWKPSYLPPGSRWAWTGWLRRWSWKAGRSGLWPLSSRRNFGSGSGLQILCLENHYQMCSAPCHGEMVRRVLDLRRNVPLSQAAMEVLAVVAYNQPVTKSFVEQVRGVDCSRILGSLIVKGLLEERGRLELPGRPLLYGTTPDFLRCLGLRSLEELPPLPPLDGTERESLENQTEEHSSACQE